MKMSSAMLVRQCLVISLTAWIALVAGAWAGGHIDTENGYATAEELGLMKGFPPPPEKRVNRSNALQTPPYVRWSFLNMRTVYPTANINSADTPVQLPRKADKGIQGLMVTNPETGEKVDFDTYLKMTYSDALVVVEGDTLRHESYLNGMNADQPHQMMSVTKSFAGLMNLIAAENGKLKESDRVVKYIPELAGTAFDATVGQVSDMTNSWEFSEDYANPRSGIIKYATVLGFAEPLPDETYEDDIYEFLQKQKKDPAHDHGEIFHYQTPKTDVVNWVTNRATGQSFETDLEERLWKKLGTEGETYVLLDKDGTLFAGGGLNATPMNLARFAAMMLNDGEFNGQRVISADIIKTLSEGGNIDAFSNGPESSGVLGNKDWSYRAQWWVRHTPGKEAFTAIGVHGQWIYIDVDRNIAIIKQSSQPVSSVNYYDEFNINAFDAVIEHLAK
ncbi:MAG: serine hydrolase domain-containing protein [Gammaproteobacteria bacterium]